MLRGNLLMLCVALASACAHTVPTGAPAPLREDDRTGIHAQLLPSTSSNIVAFHVSEPAYVAVFAFHRSSATLLYPQRRGQLAPLDAGVHRAFTSQAMLPFSSRAMQRMAPHFSAAPRPITYLLIASAYPLNVASLIHNPERLRRDMRFSMVGFSDQATISYLTELAVPPNIPDEAWTSDLWHGWSTPSSHTFSYAALQAELLYTPIACSANGLVSGFGPWAGLPCPRPPRPRPPAEKPPNDSTPEEPAEPDGEVRLGGGRMDSGSRITRPIVDPAVDARVGTRSAHPEPTRDVRSEPSRDRAPAVDGTREREGADRTRERARERPSEPRRTRRDASSEAVQRPARPSGESAPRAPRQNTPQDASRPTRPPAPQRAATRQQSPPPRAAETKAATPDPRR